MIRTKGTTALASALTILALAAVPARAQTPPQPPPPPPQAETAAPPDEQPDPDRMLNPGQPEFTVVNLPTTLRLPRRGFAFRITHRFNRDISGGFGELVEDFFGFDSGAQIGLELRYGLMRGWQVGINRTSDRTIQLFTQYSVLRQAGRTPFAVDAYATVEGTNNLRKRDSSQVTGRAVRSPALGAVVSRVFGRVAAVSMTAAWVHNTNSLPSELVDHNDTAILGVGGRIRIRPTVYLVGEVVPRVAGDSPGVTLGSFGIEKRVGGHAFQVNFSNGIGTTLAQIARGGIGSDQWHIGFNINRKFF